MELFCAVHRRNSVNLFDVLATGIVVRVFHVKQFVICFVHRPYTIMCITVKRRCFLICLLKVVAFKRKVYLRLRGSDVFRNRVAYVVDEETYCLCLDRARSAARCQEVCFCIDCC